MTEHTVVRRRSTSFIVRLWADEDDASFRGEVEHIGTGEKRLFLNGPALLSLLEAWARDLASVH